MVCGDDALARALARDARKTWQSFAAGTALELHGFDGGLEIRPGGHDKGDAVRTVLGEMPSDTVAAYLGDDVTDEDAFTALDGRGLTVLVRGELRTTAAEVWLTPPSDLVAFLERWERATSE